MTPEEKQLLLRDLCARLPYKVICNALIRSNKTDTSPVSSDYCLTHNLLNYVWIDCRKLRPYLRPMSSMTEEEKVEYKRLCVNAAICNDYQQVDYLNSNHFDYRGLIEKGLAIEAPEGMYEI